MQYQSATQGPSILVVDDSQDVRNVLSELLRLEGYCAVMAADGVEALEQVDGNDICLILLDETMPRLDGAGFCRSYRQGGGQVPIVLLTAAAGERVPPPELDVNGYIAKPFDIQSILDMVEQHCRSAPS